MTKLVWKTDSNLGTVANESYFEKPLEVTGFSNISYQVISGRLPPGVELTDDGNLNGVPRILTATAAEANKEFYFTVRAGAQNKIADKTFSLLVSAVQAPTITTTLIDLGDHYDGDYFSYQLEVQDQPLGSDIAYKLVAGTLPLGITMSSNGLLEGFFYQNKVDTTAFNQLGWDNLTWDRYIFDFIQQQQDRNYQFTIEITDGESTVRQNYKIFVAAKDLGTVDKTYRTADQTIDISRTDIHLPFVTDRPGRLPEIRYDLARQNTYFSYKFSGMDFDDDSLYFEITSPDELGFDQDGSSGWDNDEFDASKYPMPMYLGLNNQTGWYTGKLARQNLHKLDYTVQIYCRKPNQPELKGPRSNFIVTVLGQYDEDITWVTDTNLGSIDNGQLSIIRVEARHSLNKNLEYFIKSGSGRTPQGIVLDRNGMLSGRVSFNFLQFDQNNTSFDNKKTKFDQLFTFTIVARTADSSAYSEKTFQWRVNCVNSKPFENLYLKAFPNKDQRILFDDLMTNQEYFPDDLIYRPFDPYYGKAKDLRFLLLPGINPKNLSTYALALNKNHYTKTVLLGNVRVAYAYDDNLNLQYEVVYLEVLDDLEGKDPITKQPAPTAQSIDLSKNKNKFSDGITEYIEYTPNGLDNMRKRIIELIGVASTDTLPGWMTSPQPDPDNAGRFLPPLGFVKGVVLTYAVPGAGKLIAYRIKNANINFNHIPFTTDRYQLDNWLSKNYDIEQEQFIPGVETIFDQVPSVAQRYREIGEVDYAVSVPFSFINGQGVDDIINNGWLDGATIFAENETLVFTQQREFPPEVDSYIDKILKGRRNERSAIFRITITDTNLVKLERLVLTNPGDIITITKGTTNLNKKLVLEAYTVHGEFPLWWKFDGQLINYAGLDDKLVQEHQTTSFDKHQTKFISNRDQFADLDTTGKYIKFPKNGVFI